MVQSSEFDPIITQVLTDNTAQSVLNHLKALESNRAHVRTRWVWELLQNARDAAPNSDRELAASVVQGEDEIVFRHNGDNFKPAEVIHLIYHGSTKVESEETIGQYGSGFLTTHLLSPEIEVSGRLEDNRNFRFRLKRELGSVKELSDSMRKAAGAFASSLSISPANGSFTTEFRYPLREDAFDVVSEGIAKLKRCAPFIAAFNRQFATISIEAPGEIVVFNVIGRTWLQQSGIEQITVSETTNDNEKVRQYLIAHGNQLSVAIPVESADDGEVCRPVEDTPRLFLGFPLIGTEDFSFPAVINSFRFTPTENRDGVFLWQAEDATNRENQAVIEEACELLVAMLQFVATSGWRDAYHLANIPALQGQSWLDRDKLRECLKTSLVERVRQTPAVINESGEALPPKESEIPVANTPGGVTSLWDLLVEWQVDGDIWPRRDEAAGWCDAVKSWARLSDCEPTTFDGAIDGRELAATVDDISHDRSADPRTHRVSLFADSLKGNIPAINWLDQLIGFLRANGQGDEVSECRIVPSQEGFLRALPNLHRDVGISEELKTVAGLLEWRIKPELRDTRITALAEETGRGDWDNNHVVGELIRRLQGRAEQNPDAAFMKASVRLFTWLIRRENWERLRGFPVFSGGENNRPVTIVYLPRNEQADDRPLAPVKTWPADLQPFADLFPPSRIMADAFFAALPEPDAWRQIAGQNVVRQEILISSSVNFGKFYPDQLLLRGEVEHGTTAPVPVTDIWHRADIMERVRDSQTRARLFWRFLTEWLSPKDLESLEIKQAQCQCAEEHRYYSAAWIEPLRESAWVRLGTDARVAATARSLASLLRDSDAWNPAALEENSAAGKLLAAIGVSRLELVRELVAGNDDVRSAVDNAFIDMLAITGGNASRLGQAHQYLKDLETDPDLPQVVANHLARQRQVHQNQSLGALVEDLVKQSLEGEGFTVRNTGVGSDFEIEYDLATLEINKSGRSWLVEVKATRSHEVRMTDTQAKTAVEEGEGFLLCVVPVAGEISDLGLDEVRGAMRFVQNIGDRVEPLCSNLAGLDALRNDITADASQGVQLVVVGGTARISVKSPVWEDEGFPLAELSDRLK